MIELSSEMPLKADVLKIIAPLCSTSHKGVCGRIGVIGGSPEYTGAPYFAAISALRTGADLSHVFCPIPAAPVIKSYSPDLIVHPLLGEGEGEISTEPLRPWFERLHGVVLGPGLGRSLNTESIRQILRFLMELKIPLVIDADGLFYINNMLNEIKGHHHVILTPNIVELQRLERAIGGNDCGVAIKCRIKNLSRVLGNVTIVCKGSEDIISDGDVVIKCNESGSSRRCGGQGDLLSGSLATFLTWAYRNPHSPLNPSVVAGYAACTLTREANRLGFLKYGRGLLTQDMVDLIPQAFSNLFEVDAKLGDHA